MKVIEFYKNFLIFYRPWLVKVAVLFAVGFLAGIGYFFVDAHLLDKITQLIKDAVGFENQLNIQLAWKIFVQNLTASGLAMIGGLLFGLGPVAVMLFNGFILGYVIIATIFEDPGNIFGQIIFFALALLPHGVIELLAVFLAAAVGLKLGLNWLSKLNRGQRLRVFAQDLKQALVSMPLIALLLLVAAFVEVYVTGGILSWLSNLK